MQGYPHFFLFSFFIPSDRPANEAKWEGRAKERERDDEQGGGGGEKKSLVIVR